MDQNNSKNDFLSPTKATPIKTNNIKSLKKINDVGYVMTFGQYEGWTIDKIIKENPGYILWLHDKTIQGIVVDADILNSCHKMVDKKKADYNLSKNCDDDGYQFVFDKEY